MDNWFISSGNYEILDNKIVFHGTKIIPKTPIPNYAYVPSQGLLINNKKFINGTIKAEIEFNEIDSNTITSCHIIFNYQNINGEEKFFSIGISKSQYCAFEFKNFGNLKDSEREYCGSPLNIKPDNKISIEVTIIGSSILFKFNDITVLKKNITMKLSSSQVGIYCQSGYDITIHKYEICPIERKAFIVMQFDKQYDDLYYNVIAPVCKEFNYYPERADESANPGSVIQDIISKIKESSIIIADITPDNPNVFYEVGYSQALNKPVILLNEKNKRDRLPFDISGFRVIFYENSIGGKGQVEKSLRQFLLELDKA